ncbi:hypothetical protein [Pseudobacteriovorax antillogorgiicola]|uniref:hypothetical protein n=1 Tax=Pseudobacteriovorax antillogorgiicola TaxID=1513793 RepID=UPI001049723F|nr:hypothetical protein [Pseudobacteriovorax antillogorgiicola]
MKLCINLMQAIGRREGSKEVVMAIGKVIRIPPNGYTWGQVRDEYGNSWSVRGRDIPSGKSAGDDLAYRLDFSSPTDSPRIVSIEDD